MEEKKELDKEYEFFWNNIGLNGIDIEKKVVIAGGLDMKRYKSIYGIWSCDPDHVLLKEDENGNLVDITDCIIAQQDNMMLGDSLDNLNDQIQVKSNDIFDVMIIMKRKGKNEKI